MAIVLYNTLQRKKEKFVPLNGTVVKMYHCGPTAYDRQHIGNMRSAVIWDILRRVLEFHGFQTKQIINVTDFGHLSSDNDSGEDKMARGLKRENLPFTLESMKALAKKYASLYEEDRKKLNTLKPEAMPFASDFIKEQVELIKKLTEKKFTYKTKDGIYFDISKFDDYGKLGNRTSDATESRIKDTSEKKNVFDFALWKFSSRDENSTGWESPWGKGFPGWHIECSAISMKFLGETFDIHSGGIEHIAIHHNNEIAQSESATGKPLARFWMHNEHLLLKDSDKTDKMAKSAGNVITLEDIEHKGFDPLSLRYLFLQAHYRSPILFSWKSLEASQSALEKIRNFLSENDVTKLENPPKSIIREFKKNLENDLNTPKALALLWKVLKDKKLSRNKKISAVLEFDKVLGLNLAGYVGKKEKNIPTEVTDLLLEREKARELKDWQKADKLRQKIEELGFLIKDNGKQQNVTPTIKNRE